MCEPYKQFSDLQADNPKGLEPLDSPHNWANNPGPILGRAPMRGPSTMPQRSVIGSGNTVGRSAIHGSGSVAYSAPGTLDPSSDMGAMGHTSGYSG